ncbi:MAG: sulfite exporter TauE/SafE family protein [Ruminococcus sp.]|jgi:uncharacterized membrane protein YfcA|nr:sulfite exporter TauE/SafE family protein [Ruminococcus sp.]
MEHGTYFWYYKGIRGNKFGKYSLSEKLSRVFFAAAGFVIGTINGVFGSGGGVAAVPALEHAKIPVKKAHASSLAVTLPLSIVSAVVYSGSGDFPIKDALVLIPFGLAGAIIGSLVLKKIKNVWLKRIFGVLLIGSGAYMLFS